MSDRLNRVMITGGSSFVGRYLTAALSDKKYEITSVYHQHLPEPMTGVFPVCSDFSSPDLLAAPLRGIHTVFHLAWAYNLKGQPERHSNQNSDHLRKPANLIITENLVKSMESLGTKRIVFISAIGANKNAKHPFLKEKYLAELCILNSKIPEKIIIRSAPICGGEGTSDRMTYAIEKLLKTPFIYPIPHSEQRFSPVHIDSMTKLLVDLESFDLNGYGSLLYEMSGSEEFTVRQLFQKLAAKKGIRSKLSMGGFMGDSLSTLFDRVKKEERDFIRFRDYCGLVGEFDKYINQRNPLQSVVPEKVDGFEKIVTQ